MRAFKVLIRLDAGGSVGLGHLRRCLALANALHKQGVRPVGFLTRFPAFVRKWTGKKFPVVGLKSRKIGNEIWECSKLFSKAAPDLLILDHYEYTPEHVRKLRGFLKAVAYVDDRALWKTYPVDAVINHNVDAPKLKYPKRGPKLFLGTQYSLMSEELKALRRKRKKADARIFMTLGGGAAPKDIQKLLRAFAAAKKRIPAARLSMAPGLGWTKQKSGQGIKGVEWVAPRKFLQAMSRCSLAVSSSGVTTYELACLGIPSILLVAADNQEGIYGEMKRRKCAVGGGSVRKIVPEKLAEQIVSLWHNKSLRKTLSRKTQTLVGIDGPAKLAKALKREFL